MCIHSNLFVMSDVDQIMLNIDEPDAVHRLCVSTVVRQLCEPNWSWDHTRRASYFPVASTLVWLVTGGEATLEADGETHALRRGSVVVAPMRGHTYHGRHCPESPFEVTWLFFQVVDQRREPVPICGVDGISFHTRLGDMVWVEALMERVLTTRGAVQGIWLMGFLDEVRRQSLREGESGVEQQLRRLGETMQARPGQYRGLAGLAGPFNCSKDHFIRLFRGYHGVTPGEFLIRARTDKARGLLVSSQLSVKQISAQLGYADAYTFSRQFKQRTGVAPRRFRLAAAPER